MIGCNLLSNSDAKALSPIINGRLSPYKNMESIDALRLIGTEIIYCAATYLGIGKDKNDKEVIRACAELVKDRFSNIGVGEIKEAFSLASAGMLDEKVNLRAYYGQLNAVMIGELLVAYIKYRREKIAQFEAAKDELLKLEEEKQKEAKNQAARAEMRMQIFRALQGVKTFNDWQEIPHHWAEFALAENIIYLKDERKKEIWERAIDLSVKLKEKEAAEKRENGRLIDARNIWTFLEKVKAGDLSAKEDFRAIAMAIYSKLIIWEFLPKEKII